MGKVADLAKPEWDQASAQPSPRITVVVPARNEAECIEQCLTSLLAQDYPNFQIVAVDDRSVDSTGAIMVRLLNAQNHDSRGLLSVIHVTELPSGWLGKTHAMWAAAQQGSGDWILFTDGDIIFRQDTLRRAVNYVTRSRADHLVIYPTVIMKSFGERMMLGFFQILFLFGPRAWKVSDPKARDHIGAGAFNFIRRSAYEKLGTYQALRLEVIDDLQLGREVKQHGFSQHIAFGVGLVSLRWGKGAFGVVGNLTKNLFALMRFRWPIALAAALLVAFLNLGPFVGVLVAPGWSKLGYGIGLMAIAAVYVRLSKLSKISPLFFFTHPVSTSLFVGTILRSAWLTLVQGGVIWRGTKYPLHELRAAQIKTKDVPVAISRD